MPTREKRPPLSMAARRRPRRVPRLAIAAGVLVAISSAALIIYGHRSHLLVASLFRSPEKHAPSVALITELPQCERAHGQFYLTKALQTKLAYARAKAWEIWPLGGGESEAAAAAMLLQYEQGRTALSRATWPALVLNALASTKVDWLVWMDPETLVSQPNAVLPFAAWVDAGADVVLPPHSVEKGMEFAAAFVRNSEAARAFLAAWVEAIDTLPRAGDQDNALVSRALQHVLARDGAGHARVLHVSAQPANFAGGLLSTANASSRWLSSFRGCGLCDVGSATLWN